jgi:xylulokinase
MKTLLTIDVGTSSTKVALFSQNGRLLDSEQVTYAVQRPRSGWAEQDPGFWWDAVCLSAKKLLKDDSLREIAAVAVSGQTPSCVAIDTAGKPIRPAILWLDRRSVSQVEWLENHVSLKKAVQRSANTLDSYYGGAKWLWFAQEEPAAYRNTWKILQAGGYIVYQLTGKAVIDYSQAGLCSPCFNMKRREWDQEICDLMGIQIEKLPQILPSTQIIGQVTRKGAQESGIPVETPVATGAGDFALSCLGAGVLEAGTAAAMLGTAGNLLVPEPSKTDPRLINTIHVNGNTLSLGGVYAGGSLEWFKGLFRSNPPDFFAQVENEAKQTSAGANGLLFLPYLMGERTPIWDPQARGVFFGLSNRHGRGHLYRSILEGVALAFRQILEIVTQTGTDIQEIVLTDGGAQSPLWRQIFSDVLQIPVRWQPHTGGTSLGTAYLAAVANGQVPGFGELSQWLTPTLDSYPNSSTTEVYDDLFEIYWQFYERVKDLYPRLTVNSNM